MLVVGVGFGCQGLVLVVRGTGIAVGVFVGSWLSSVGCWLLIVGVDPLLSLFPLSVPSSNYRVML
jgi:hypothetical protein